ncbi:tryptophan synthase beta subunit-like PLP-dependent enzyme [Lipomyces japonicus]|uniref:tryptophan synthase beta subunit-like PLP-dependent enzyme n=1 Tax=Lipomyces japonicus TaxID=56871 RepID=UPI0034CDE645
MSLVSQITSDVVLSRQGVEDAYKRIVPHVKRTPVLTNASLSALATGHEHAQPTTLYFKCENFQKGGAFKIRGATHALSKLSPDQLQHGVITHSSGNHAQALSIAAREKNCKAYIVMPSNSAKPKVAATKGYGGEVHFSGPSAQEREAVTATIQARTGANLIPPYDHADIILGQGTVVLELLEQTADSGGLDAIIVPVGGGGLLAGSALAAQGSGVRVFGAEPELADDCYRGLQVGKRIVTSNTATVADGLRTPVGTINFPIIQRHVDKVFTVSEQEIINAMRLVWERLKIVIEPSSAVVVAVVLSQKWKDEGVKGKVGLVISGGNVDLSTVGELFTRLPKE